MDKFQQEMLGKITSDQDLTEFELKEFAFKYSIKDINKRSSPNSTNVTSIIQFDNKYFAIDWFVVKSYFRYGISVSVFRNQPYEVKQAENNIAVKDYVKV